jgi:hypothetical protein
MNRLLLLLLLILLPILVLASNLQAQTTFVAFLLTSEEQLANHATSVGYANFTLSADRQRLDYQMVCWGIQDPTQAHIHVGRRGVDGTQVKDLQIIQDRYARGSWLASDQFQPLTSALVDSLLAGGMYINVHTLLNPSGEIRGQIMQPETYVSLASGLYETPPVSQSGTGIGFFAVDPANASVFIRGQAGNMSSKIVAAHVHNAPVGTPGPVVEPTPMALSALDSLSASTELDWTNTDTTNPLTGSLLDKLRTGGLYWNVHTELNQTGEIRGQIRKGLLSDADTGLWFMAILSGSQEGVAGKASNGSGTAFLHLSPDGTMAKIGALVSDLDGPVVGAHIHHGFIGDVPPNNVVVEIPTNLTSIWTSDDPVHPLTSEDIDSLFAGEYYINVHTSTYPDGEIRGQLLPMSSRAELKMRVPRVRPSAASVSVYPNPSTANVRLQLGDVGLSDPRIHVVNALGADVASLQCEGTTAVYNTQSLAGGVYSFILQTKSGAVSVPFTVLH